MGAINQMYSEFAHCRIPRNRYDKARDEVADDVKYLREYGVGNCSPRINTILANLLERIAVMDANLIWLMDKHYEMEDIPGWDSEDPEEREIAERYYDRMLKDTPHTNPHKKPHK